MRARRRLRGHGSGRGEAGGHLSTPTTPAPRPNTPTPSSPPPPPTPPTTPTRIGILGGTFDPVHNGHIVAGATTRHALQLDVVLFVVANAPWQKAARRLAPAEDRYDLVATALDGVDGLEPSRIEIDRGGTTYTADTVQVLNEQHPGATLFLVVGTDVADDLDTWDRVGEIRQRADLAVVTRPRAKPVDLPGWRTHRVEIPQLDISSTDLRRRAAHNEPLDGLMPPKAVRLLQERALYAGTG